MTNIPMMAHEWATAPRLYLDPCNTALVRSYDRFGRFDGWVMSDEMKDWCGKFLTSYTFNKVSLLIRFVNEDEMVFFKLTWGGA